MTVKRSRFIPPAFDRFCCGGEEKLWAAQQTDFSDNPVVTNHNAELNGPLDALQKRIDRIRGFHAMYELSRLKWRSAG